MADNSFSFQSYLEAKESLDERSLSAPVRDGVLSYIASAESRGSGGGLRVLDAGTGTGAMIRRLARWVAEMPQKQRPARMELLGIDTDPDSLRTAELRTAPLVPGAKFLRGDLAAADGSWACEGAYNLITANAVLDLLPIEDTVRLLRSLLAPSGGLYATINYDGLTELIPPYEEAPFEERLLAWYDRSMDLRAPAAGSRTGRALPAALMRAGFALEAVGASDWVIAPTRVGYPGRDEEFAGYLLSLMRNEGERNRSLPAEELARWLQARRRALEKRELIVVVHQLDLFARAPRERDQSERD